MALEKIVTGNGSSVVATKTDAAAAPRPKRPHVPTLMGVARTPSAEVEPLAGVVRDAVDAGREIARDTVELGLLQAHEAVRETVAVAKRTMNETVETVKRTAREVVDDVAPRLAWGAVAAVCGFVGAVLGIIATFIAAEAVIASVAVRLGIAALMFLAVAGIGIWRAGRPRASADRPVHPMTPSAGRHHPLRPVDGIG